MGRAAEIGAVRAGRKRKDRQLTGAVLELHVAALGVGGEQVIDGPELGGILEHHDAGALDRNRDVGPQPPAVVEEQAPLRLARRQRQDGRGQELVEPLEGIAPGNTDLAPASEVGEGLRAGERFENHMFDHTGRPSRRCPHK